MSVFANARIDGKPRGKLETVDFLPGRRLHLGTRNDARSHWRRMHALIENPQQRARKARNSDVTPKAIDEIDGLSPPRLPLFPERGDHTAAAES